MGKTAENLMKEPISRIVPEATLDHTFEGFTEEQVIQVLTKDGLNGGAAFYDQCHNMKGDKGSDRGITVSAAFNRMLKKDDNTQLDGFDRMLRALGIPTKNDLNYGVFAGSMDLFYTSDAGSILIPEFINRELRKIHEERYSLKGLVAEQVYTPNGQYQAPTWDLSALETGLRPVGERGEFPEAALGFSSVSGTVGKRGVKIPLSYEVLRRMNINIVASFLERVSVCFESDLMGELIETLLNNATTTTKVSYGNGEEADSGIIDYKTWLAWTAGSQGLRYNKVAGALDATISVITMEKPGTDPIQMNALLAGLAQKLTGDSVKLRNAKWEDKEIVDHSDVPANTLVSWDSRFAVYQYSEIGLDMVQTADIISRQFKEVIVSAGDEFEVAETATVRKLTGV